MAIVNQSESETPMDVEGIAAELEQLSDSDLQGVIGRVLPRVMKAALTKPATTLDLVVTLDCNLRCDYCFVGGKQPGKVMSTTTAERAIDLFLACCSKKYDPEIVFFGGEPLLELDLLRHAAAYARSQADGYGRPVRFSITTNGTLLDEAALDFAEEFGIHYMLSLDGAQPTHDKHRRTGDGRGSFARIAQNLPLLKERQDWLAAHITVSPDTAATLAEDVHSLFAMGINQFFIEPDFFAPWSPPQMKQYQEQFTAVADLYTRLRGDGQPIRIVDFESSLEDRRGRYAKRWGCHAGRGRLTVTPDGGLYPCNRFSGLCEGEGQYRLGDLDKGIEKYAFLRDLMDDRDIVRPGCMACEASGYCQGGCPAANLTTGGTIYTVSPIYCAHTQALVAALRERPEILEFRWSEESPIKTCCGDEPPCGESFPVAPAGAGAKVAVGRFG